MSTALMAVIIAVTAIAAFRLVRLKAAAMRATGEQIAELRKATKFEGTPELFREPDSEFQRDAGHFVQFNLVDRLRDHEFPRRGRPTESRR